MPHPFFAVFHAAGLFDGVWGAGRLDAGTTSRNRCLRSCGDLWIVDSLTGVQRLQSFGSAVQFIDLTQRIANL